MGGLVNALMLTGLQSKDFHLACWLLDRAQEERMAAGAYCSGRAWPVVDASVTWFVGRKQGEDASVKDPWLEVI